jgi:tetratricopeptide (TPR) repeat protein
MVKADVQSSVSGYLMTITRLLKTSQPAGVQYRLCSLVSNAAQILGEISYDLDRIVEAEQYYQLAARAATEVDNRVLEATALGRHGFLPIHKGSPASGLPKLEQAIQLTQVAVTGKTQAWALMLEAEALARIPGKKNSCLSILNKVEEVRHTNPLPQEDGPNRDDRKWTGFSEASQNAYKGACLLHLHESEQAQVLLQGALDKLGPGPTKRRSLILTDLAETYLQSQDVEQACKLTTEALIIAAQAQSARSIQRLKNFQRQLGPWQEVGCVRQFNNAIKMVAFVRGG